MRAMSLGGRIREARLAAGKTLQQVGDLFGITRQAAGQWEKKKDPTIPEADKIPRLAKFFDVTTDWLYEGGDDLRASRKSDDVVMVTGYVGGGQAVHQIEGSDANLEEVERPQGVDGDLVAVQIRGDSMRPLKDGWLLFYRREAYGVPDECRNQLCVCELDDGRTYVKELRWGSKKGHFTLMSWNADPLEDVRLKWAAKVLDIRPR